jgi:glyoxylase-like metal-dependent hydrolase (beta-lactamase superfamily II)
MRQLRVSGESIGCTFVTDGRGGLPDDLVFSDLDDAGRAVIVDEWGSRDDVPFTSLVIKADAKVVVVDCGLGSLPAPLGGRGGELTAQLGLVGVSPIDVDIVVLSHGHPDHIGGLLSEGGTPRFARARHVLALAEWRLWTNPGGHEQVPAALAELVRAQLLPLEKAGLVDFIEEETEIAPGVEVIPAPGHTAGHLAVEVGRTAGLLYAADAFTHPAQIAHPDWGRGFDMDPDEAVETRRRLLGRAVAGGRVIAAGHCDDLLHP